MRLRTMVAGVAAAAVALVGCGGDRDVAGTDPGYRVVTEGTLRPGDAIPAPQGDVILRVTGAIAAANGDGVAFDLATLESIGLVAYTVDDQQAEGREVEFSGVLLSDLLAVVGASPDATTLETVALNDYAVQIPVADAADSPVMIATSVDGERMPVDRYGPTRVVYPYGSHDLDPTVYDPRWIWQLATIDVS